jgi:hypothetical protein
MLARDVVAVGLAGVLGAGVCGCAPRGAPPGPTQCPPAAPASGDGVSHDGIGALTGSATDAWTIGSRRGPDGQFQRRVLLHWDGCDWKQEASPFDNSSDEYPLAVWANGSELWLSGSQSAPGGPGAYPRHCGRQRGRVFRQRDGVRQEVQVAEAGTRAAFAIGGSGSDDVWMLERDCAAIGGEGSTIRHWNGKSFVDVPAPQGLRSFASVWPSGPGDAWVGGEGGVAHWDGTAWRTFTLGEERIYALAGSGPTDVWARGKAMHRWDGRRWTEVTSPPTRPKGRATGMSGLGGVSGGHVFATDAEGNIYRSERAALKVIGRIRSWIGGTVGSPVTWQAFVSGRDELSLFLGDTAQRPAMRWSNGKWTVTAPDLAGEKGEAVVALWSDGSPRPWAAISFALASSSRAGEIRRWNGAKWEAVAPLDQFPKRFWGVAPDDIWLVGLGGASWHWDGKRWTAVPTGTSEHLFSVWGSSRGDVWAGGESGTLLRWDGAAWRPWSMLYQDGPTVVALAGTAEDFVIAAGPRFIGRWDGRGWIDGGEIDGGVRLYGGTADFQGAWGRSASDFWVVGTGGDVQRLDGNSYRVLPTPYVLHWDGKLWKRVETFGGASLRAITGTAANEAWAAGDGGTVLHWDGTDWVSVPSGTEEDLYAVAKTPDGAVWIGGAHGTLRRIGLRADPSP